MGGVTQNKMDQATKNIWRENYQKTDGKCFYRSGGKMIHNKEWNRKGMKTDESD